MTKSKFHEDWFMIVRLMAVTCFLFVCSSRLLAQEYSASAGEAAPTGTVAPEISSLLTAKGIKVNKGSTTVCELWFAKEWPIEADAKTGGEVLYPLSVGQVIGVIRFAKKASDFREQDVPAGVYVMRYTQQPVDGAHVGTSPTRDFLALSPAAKDRDPKTIDYKALVAASKETTGTAHPAIFSLQRPEDGASPSVREVSEKEWVIVHYVGKVKQGGGVKDLPLDLVVVGKSAE
ncbi:MAG TPA: hypothetical protein VGI40_18425 [Pirellulaceae bacterium]